MPTDIDLRLLRRGIIAALAQDPTLSELLVLKGGNAIGLVHGVGHRASLDVDYSMAGDVKSPADLGRRIFAALRPRLAARGWVLFDEQFSARPTTLRVGADPTWGGYLAEFKLVSVERSAALAGDPDALRRSAVSVDGHAQGGRRFRIEISKHELCEPTEFATIEPGITCRVYTVELIVAEKFRALCQQMDGYAARAHPAPRARDFYDLHALITERGVELSTDEMLDLIEQVFLAKEVPVRLLAELAATRDFHESDWPSAAATIPAARARDFGFYFGFVVEQARKLEPLWHVNPP